MTPARFRLKLYVRAGISGQALSQLYKALEHHPYTDYQLEIIDIIQAPERALDDGVVKVPTLVSELSDGGMIICDDLSNTNNLRMLFGFNTGTP